MSLRRQFSLFLLQVSSWKLSKIQRKVFSFLMSKLSLDEHDLFPRYKTMNNKTKEIGWWTCEGLDLRNLAPFCSLTDFYCPNIERQFSLFLLQVLSWKLTKIQRKVPTFWWVSFFWSKTIYFRDIRRSIIRQRKLVNELVRA